MSAGSRVAASCSAKPDAASCSAKPDEARLLALRQRAAAAALVRELAPGIVEFEQSASLVAALSAEGLDLGEAARGNARELAQRLELAVLGHRSAPVLHVVAVLFERLALQLEESPAASVPVALSLRRRALEAWRLLARDGKYLRTLLSRITRADEEAAVESTIQQRVRSVLEAWVKDAEAPLLAGQLRGVVILALLRELEHDRAFAEFAKESRESLVDGLLAPLRAEDRERLAGRASSEDRVASFGRWAELWHATSRDGYLALRTLELLVDFGWELRSASKYTQLSELYRPFRPMLDELALDVRRRGPAASYASLVGDAYVQLASAEPTTDDKIASCERALYTCPRHKLAESVLAFYLSHRAIERIEAAKGVIGPALATELEAVIARARGLDPTDTRLALLVERYRAATGRNV